MTLLLVTLPEAAEARAAVPVHSMPTGTTPR